MEALNCSVYIIVVHTHFKEYETLAFASSQEKDKRIKELDVVCTPKWHFWYHYSANVSPHSVQQNQNMLP